MNASAPPPGRPAIDKATLFEPDPRDWLRLIGGVLLAAGAVVLFVRKEEPWADFPLFLVALVPAVALYGLGMLAGVRRGHDGVGRPEGWQVVFLILGTLLIGLTVTQLFVMLGSDNLEHRLLQALVAASVAAAAYVASFLRRVPVLALVGGFAALTAWVLFWDKLTTIDSVGSARAFLIIFAALLLAAGVALHRAKRPQAVEFITVAGVAALVAGVLSVGELSGVDPIGDDSGTAPSEGWNVFILGVSLALIAYGGRSVTRGAGYVGALGFLAFVSLTGANVVALAEGNFDDRDKLVGWPLLLLLLAVAALVASFVLPRGGLGSIGRGPTTGPAGVPGAPRPGAGYGPGAGPYPGGQQPGPGGYPPPGQPPPQQQHPPAGPPDATVARPIPPQQPPQQQQPAQPPPQQQPPAGPPGDATVARPIPPQQPPQSPDRPTERHDRPPPPPGGPQQG